MVGGDWSVYSNRPYGRVSLNCTRLINNQTGIKGTDVYFRGANINIEDDLGTGNVFQNRANGLLFDICYNFGGPRFFQASDNFWVGGFEAATQ